MSHSLRHRLILLAGLAATAFCGRPALAATDPADAPALSFLKSKGVTLTLLGKSGDVSVWMGEREGQMQYFSVLPDGHRVVAGILFDDGGHDITGDLLAKAIAAGRLHLPTTPGASASAAAPTGAPANVSEIWAAAAGAHWLSYGRSGAPVVYMLADPDCIFCRTVWPEVLRLTSENKIELRVIPVAIIHGEDSVSHLTTILAASSPAKAWATAEEGVLPPPASATAAIRGIITDNDEFAHRFGLAATPVFLWSSASGPHMQTGIPKAADGSTDVGLFLR